MSGWGWGFLLQSLKNMLRAFQRDKKGATAVEFAILAPVFFTLFFSIFEAGYLFSKVAMLDYAVSKVAKQIYIGAANRGVVTYEDIEKLLCDNVVIGGKNCTKDLHIELVIVEDLTDFPDKNVVCQDSQGENINPIISFNGGVGVNVMFMRVCLMTNILVPGLGLGLQLPKTDANRYAIVATTAFVNEPF
ncbi:MAG: pilus assembly protein [Rhizobiales bacterium]|nr:pilus assembly protein [Hyphomicrobiales bacterium]